MRTDPAHQTDPLDPIVLAIPCLAACLHVPPQCRKERHADILIRADVRIRQARRADMSVSAWLASPSGRDREAVLTDGCAHYAPLTLRIGQPLDLEAFRRTLRDPACAPRLQQARVGMLSGTPTFEALPMRQLVDDGHIAARAHAQAVADTWLVIDGIVHQRILPPCMVVRFARDDHRRRFHVGAHAAPEPHLTSIYVRLSPTEDAAPYADALCRSGREPTGNKGYRIEPGDVPVTFGPGELLADIRACVPLLVSAGRPIRRPSADIRTYATLGRRLRERDGSDLAIAGAVIETLSSLASSPGEGSALALYAHRLAALS